jgi:aspartate aminotransferase
VAKLADRISWMKPSETLEINARAQQLKALGLDVLSFAAGEPDFATPAHIREAARAAMEAGYTRYTAVPGDPELRALVASRFAKSHGLESLPAQVVVGCGAKQIIAHFFNAVLEPGDEVIVPTPCWVSYPTQIRMVGGTPVLVPTTAETGWCLTPEALRDHVTPRSRALVLNAPCNPTGGVYESAALEALAAALGDFEDLWVLSDEIYRSITFDGFVQRSLVAVAPSLAARTMVIDGVSKTYSMTGWRVGWGVGPAPLVTAISRLAGQVTSCAPAFAQRAAIVALEGDQSFFQPWLSELERRRDAMCRGLNAMDGVTCADSRGTFYAFADVRGVLGRSRPGGGPIADASALCMYLLDEARVAAVPGDAFSAPGFVRFSFACSMDVVQRGIVRVGEALSSLR